MDAETDKALKLLLKDAGFETEKTVAKFDDVSWSVIVSFKKDACRQSRGDWEVVEYIRKNGLLAAEIINKGYYNVYGTYARKAGEAERFSAKSILDPVEDFYFFP